MEDVFSCSWFLFNSKIVLFIPAVHSLLKVLIIIVNYGKKPLRARLTDGGGMCGMTDLH